MASSLLCILKSTKASKGLFLTICALPLNSEISPILTACACALVVLDNANIAIRSIANNLKVIPCKCR